MTVLVFHVHQLAIVLHKLTVLLSPFFLLSFSFFLILCFLWQLFIQLNKFCSHNTQSGHKHTHTQTHRKKKQNLRCTSMSVLRTIGDMLHLAAIIILLSKMLRDRSSAGISLKSMFLFALVFITRYLDLFIVYLGWYNTVMKIFFIATSCHICYLMKTKNPWKATYDRDNDTFRLRYLIIPCAILALIFHGARSPYLLIEILWAFSQYLESVAILPQIFLLEYTERYDALTSHYLFCLGAYRVFYLFNWIVRFIVYHRINLISVITGCVQSLLYVDFFYHYIIQVVHRTNHRYELAH